MHLKVFLKRKNPKNSLFWANRYFKKNKKNKKKQKKNTGLGKKNGYFSNPGPGRARPRHSHSRGVPRPAQ
jgi:hypothetical protein